METTLRRPRIGKGKPRKDLDVQSRDIEILKAHCPQSPYLSREYIAALIGQPDTPYLRQRVFSLIQDAGLLYRPLFQTNAQFMYRKTITALTDKGIAFLKSKGHEYKNVAYRAENDLHKFMRSTCHASVKLGIEASGRHFYTLEHILSHPRCPQQTQDANYPLAFKIDNERTLTPDDIWRWRIGEEHRTFFVEIDRGTEALTHTKAKRDSSVQSKLLAYEQIIGEKKHSERLGFGTTPSIAIITTTPERAQSILDMATKKLSYPERVLVTSVPYFDTYGWQIPSIIRELVTDPWGTVNGPVFINE
jgi:hypothetical protein